MVNKRYVWIGVAALVVIGLVVMGAGAAFNRGMSQGYLMGQAAPEGEEGAMMPYGFPGYGISRHSFGYRGFSPLAFGLGWVFRGILLLVVIGMIFRFLRFGAWHRAYKATGKGPAPNQAPWSHWARHWHQHHGPMPPWCWGEEKAAEEAGEAEAAAEGSEE